MAFLVLNILYGHGKQVCYDVAGAPNEDKIIVISVSQSFVIGVGDGAAVGAFEMMLLAELCHFVSTEGSLRGRLCPIVDGILREHLHNRVDILVVDHAEDNP